MTEETPTEVKGKGKPKKARRSPNAIRSTIGVVEIYLAQVQAQLDHLKKAVAELKSSL